MKEYYNILKKMEPRPAMWTGELSLKSIRTFLGGYICALHENNPFGKKEQIEANFHDWVAERLGFRESTAGWHNMILAYTIRLDPRKINWENYDAGVTKEMHEKSIQQFYLLLDEFVAEGK